MLVRRVPAAGRHHGNAPVTCTLVRRISAHDYEVSSLNGACVRLACGTLIYRDELSEVDALRLAVGAVVRIATEMRDYADGRRERVVTTTVEWSPLDGQEGCA